MDHYPINAKIPRMARNNAKPNWDAFRRAQRPHQLAWDKIREDWQNTYCFGQTREERRAAGENLGYSNIRMAVHEFFRPLYWLNDKIL